MPAKDKPSGLFPDSEKPPKIKEDVIMQHVEIRDDFMIGPSGEKRPADPIANVHRIMEIATGAADEEYVTEAELDALAKKSGLKN